MRRRGARLFEPEPTGAGHAIAVSRNMRAPVERAIYGSLRREGARLFEPEPTGAGHAAAVEPCFACACGSIRMHDSKKEKPKCAVPIGN